MIAAGCSGSSERGLEKQKELEGVFGQCCNFTHLTWTEQSPGLTGSGARGKPYNKGLLTATERCSRVVSSASFQMQAGQRGPVPLGPSPVSAGQSLKEPDA